MAQVDTLVPSFTGTTEFTVPVPCTYDLEVAATKYLDALPDGEVPLSFHFSGRIFYRGEGGRLQVVMVPWVSATFRLPVATWRGMIDRHYPGSGWIRVQDDTLRRLQLRKAERGLPTFDAAVAELLGRRGVIEELVDSLLYEGYALYPYTPGATQERDADALRDRLSGRLRVRVRPPPAGVPRARRGSPDRGRGALPAGERRRHRAVERRVGVGGIDLPPLRGEITLGVEALEPGLRRVTLTIENRTPFAGGTRAEALEHSLISTHPLLRVARRHVRLPARGPDCARTSTRGPCSRLPTTPSILGAAIVLPDHPQLAPESRGSLFDGTEIEEALLLHVHALSDAEREEIAAGTRPCARWSSARSPRRPRRSSGCTA